MPNAGQYNRRGYLYDDPPLDDFADHPEPQPIRPLWLSRRAKSATETNVNDQIAAVNAYEFRTPWTPAPLHSGQQIQLEGEPTRYEITGVYDPTDQRLEHVVLAVQLN